MIKIISPCLVCSQGPTLEPGQGLVSGSLPKGRCLAEAEGAAWFQPPMGLSTAEGVVSVGLNVVKGGSRGRFSDCRNIDKGLRDTRLKYTGYI